MVGLWDVSLEHKLLAFWLLFPGGSPTFVVALGGLNYPSRPCNGRNRPEGPKFKKRLGLTVVLGEVDGARVRLKQTSPPPPSRNAACSLSTSQRRASASGVDSKPPGYKGVGGGGGVILDRPRETGQWPTCWMSLLLRTQIQITYFH